MTCLVRNRTHPVLLIGGIALALGCGDDSPTEPPPGPPATMVFTLQSRNQQATVGQHVPADPVLLVRDADGKGVPDIGVLFTPSFGSSAQPTFLRTDANGEATTRWQLGTSARQYQLIGETLELGTVTLVATAVAGPATRLEVTSASPDGVTLGLNGTHQLTVAAFDQFGNAAELGTVEYTSTNADVATVSSTGLISARTPGIAAVTIRAGTLTLNLPVSVLNRVGGLDGNPFGIAVSPDGSFVLVTRHWANLVSRLSLPEFQRGTEIPAGTNPGDVAISPDGTVAYVMNVQGASMSVVSTSSGALLGSVAIPHASVRVRLSPDGALVYALSDVNTLTIVNAATREIVGTIPAGGNGLAVRSDGSRAYASHTSGSLRELDLSARTVTRSLALEGTPQEVVISADGSEIWVANEGGWVDVVDAATFAPVARITLASGAFGMALSPDGTSLWVGAANGGRVFVIDRAARTLARTYQTGGVPRRIAFDGAAGNALVANENGWVDVLKIAP